MLLGGVKEEEDAFKLANKLVSLAKTNKSLIISIFSLESLRVLLRKYEQKGEFVHDRIKCANANDFKDMIMQLDETGRILLHQRMHQVLGSHDDTASSYKSIISSDASSNSVAEVAERFSFMKRIWDYVGGKKQKED